MHAVEPPAEAPSRARRRVPIGAGPIGAGPIEAERRETQVRERLEFPSAN